MSNTFENCQANKQGWLEESNETYHAGPGLGSTGIKLLCETPRHYQKNISTIDPEVARIGTLIHSALLEPELLFSKLVIPPSGSRTLNEVKIKWACFWEGLNTKGWLARPIEEILHKNFKVADYHTAYDYSKCIPASREEVGMCKRIKETIGEYPSYKEKFEGVRELSGYTNILWDEMDVMIKCRPDVRNAKEGFLMDIKKVHNINMFMSQFFKLGYHLSAAYYLDICNILDGDVYKDFYWLVVEDKEPHSVMMYKAGINDQCIELGRSSYEFGLDRFVSCTRSGKWPLYPEETREIKVPKWLVQSVD